MGTLEELSAEYGVTKPSYILVKSEGPAHNRTFTYHVLRKIVNVIRFFQKVAMAKTSLKILNTRQQEIF